MQFQRLRPLTLRKIRGYVSLCLALVFFRSLAPITYRWGGSVEPVKTAQPVLAIYVYHDLINRQTFPRTKSKIQATDIKLCALKHDMYRAEQLVVQYFARQYHLKQYVDVVQNPDKATFFLVPHVGTCLTHVVRQRHNLELYSEAAVDVADNYLLPLLLHVVEASAYYNTSQGADHLFVFAHDMGPCLFHKAASYAKILQIVNPGIFMVNTAERQYPGSRSWTNATCFREGRDIALPQPIKFETCTNSAERRTLLSFRGQVHNLTRYSRGARQSLSALASELNETSYTDPFNRSWVRLLNFKTSRAPDALYRHELSSSVFYACIAGYMPWSPRLYDAIVCGSIPVIIADGIYLPFPKLVNWKEFTITLPADVVPAIIRTLLNVPPPVVSRMQKALGSSQVQYLIWKSFDEDIRTSAPSAARGIVAELSARLQSTALAEPMHAVYNSGEAIKVDRRSAEGG